MKRIWILAPVGFALCALTFSVVYTYAIQRKAALDRILELGGEFMFEGESLPKDANDTLLMEQDISLIQSLRSVYLINVAKTDLSLGDLKLLTWLNETRVLWIAGTKLDDSAAPILMRFNRLEHLEIQDVPFSAGTINSLRQEMPSTQIETLHMNM